MSAKLNNCVLNYFILINTLSQNRKKAEKSLDINGGGDAYSLCIVFNQNGANLNVTPSHRCIEYPITSEKICKFAKEFLKNV
jgi:hypothetical protein